MNNQPLESSRTPRSVLKKQASLYSRGNPRYDRFGQPISLGLPYAVTISDEVKIHTIEKLEVYQDRDLFCTANSQDRRNIAIETETVTQFTAPRGNRTDSKKDPDLSLMNDKTSKSKSRATKKECCTIM